MMNLNAHLIRNWILAEDDPEISPAPAITHERSEREIDPSVADILREEAREREQRAAETLEHQDEFALDTDEPASEPQPKKSGYIDPKLDDLDEMYKDTASDAPASRRDLLPDIEEINSTLRGIKNQQAKNSQKHRRKKCLRTAWVSRGHHPAAFGGCCLCLCRFDHIKRPQLAPYLDAYVAQIDQWRAALSDQTSGF